MHRTRRCTAVHSTCILCNVYPGIARGRLDKPSCTIGMRTIRDYALCAGDFAAKGGGYHLSHEFRTASCYTISHSLTHSLSLSLSLSLSGRSGVFYSSRGRIQYFIHCDREPGTRVHRDTQTRSC